MNVEYPKKIRQRKPRSRQKDKDELLPGEIIKSYSYGRERGVAASPWSRDFIWIVIDSNGSLDADGSMHALSEGLMYTIYNGTTFT
jgi:hypothetical protein